VKILEEALVLDVGLGARHANDYHVVVALQLPAHDRMYIRWWLDRAAGSPEILDSCRRRIWN
jgi:hypothetical protein